MRRAAALALLMAAGCGPAAVSTRPSPEQATVVRKASYSLGRIPDSSREQLFYDTVDAAYSEAAKKMGAGGLSGFTYSITPRGPVYPFSEVDVACLLRGSQAGDSGARICPVFFRALDSGFKKNFKGE